MEKSAPPRRSKEPLLVVLSSSSGTNGRRRHRDRGRFRESQDNIAYQSSPTSLSLSSATTNIPSFSPDGAAALSPLNHKDHCDSNGTSTTAMCFCCCCCYCSRNCLDCSNSGSPSTTAHTAAARLSEVKSCVESLSGVRRRKPPPIMSKGWHWVMLLMILFLFGVTMSLLSSPCPASRRGSTGHSRRVVVSAGALQHLMADGESRRDYSYNSSYHIYEQLPVRGKGRAAAAEAGEENDSWGDDRPLTQQQCNILQRILDSGIKSIQFLRSHYTGHSWPRIAKEQQQGRWLQSTEYDASVILILLTDGQYDPDPAEFTEPQWTLSNGHQNYQVRILTSFSSNQRRPRESKQQTRWNQCFVVKNQFPMGFNPLTREYEMDYNKDYLEANTSDNLIREEAGVGGGGEQTDEEAAHSMGQPRTFHFLRKLQYIEEGEEEENDEGDADQEPDERIDLRNQVNAAVNAQAFPPSSASITLRGLDRFLELVRGPPAKREAISPTTRNRQQKSQLFRLEQRLSQTRSNGSGGDGGNGRQSSLGSGKERTSAKKCKLNGKSTSCRRRKGLRRKAPTNIDNVQFTSVERDSESGRSGGRGSSRSSSAIGTRKSSGDKWKFILENFCAKSHLHGQLPKLIAKLEQQELQKKLFLQNQQQQQIKQDHGQRTMGQEGKVPSTEPDPLGRQQEQNDERVEEDDDGEDDELSMAAKTTDSLRLEVIKEQILKKLGLKRAPNVTNIWTASEASPSPVDASHNDTRGGAGAGAGDADDDSSSRNRDGRRMVEKKTANFMFGNGPTGIQLPNNNSQFFIHDGHARPMDQELFLSKELILATLYRAQLDNSVGGGGGGGDAYGHQRSHEDSAYANPSYGQATNRLFDDLHAEDGRGRRKRRKGRKRKRKSHPDEGEALEDDQEDGWATQFDTLNDEEAYVEGRRLREDLKSQTRRYLEEEFAEEEEEGFEERNHRYQWENNQQDDGQLGDEENYGQSREIITFAERGKLLNGRQHLLEFKPVGDHQTPGGGDFRIRSAVLWLKVEHLHNKQQPQNNAARNVTIWIFNMKTALQWSEAYSNDCPVKSSDPSTSTKLGEEEQMTNDKVVRNCPSSEFANYEAADAEGRRRRQQQQQNMDADELYLDEKDFNRVSELALTHTIHLPSSAKYNYHATEADMERGKFNKNINREDVNFLPSGADPQHASTLSSNGWHKFDVTSVVRRWNTVNRSSGDAPTKLQLLIDCSGCRRTGVHVHLFHSNSNNGNNQWNALPPLVNENRPFLVVRTEPNAMKRVRRRALDCSGARNGRCCKQRFYVSFKAIGWDDWIIFPHGYFANYCRGSCAYRSSDMLPTKYSTFMSEFRRLGKMAEMQSCCAPLKFSSMDLIYYDRTGKIIKSHLPQMIVDECGCP